MLSFIFLITYFTIPVINIIRILISSSFIYKESDIDMTEYVNEFILDETIFSFEDLKHLSDIIDYFICMKGTDNFEIFNSCLLKRIKDRNGVYSLSEIKNLIENAGLSVDQKLYFEELVTHMVYICNLRYLVAKDIISRNVENSTVNNIDSNKSKELPNSGDLVNNINLEGKSGVTSDRVETAYINCGIDHQVLASVLFRDNSASQRRYTER